MKREVHETGIFLRSSSDQTDAISISVMCALNQKFCVFVPLSSISLELTHSACYVLGGGHCQALACKWCVLPRNTGVRQGRPNANSPLQLSLRFVETFMTTLLIFPVREAATHSFIHSPFK